MTFSSAGGPLFDLDGTLYRAAPVRRIIAFRLLGYVLAAPVDGVRTLRLIRAYREAQETLRQEGNAAGQLAAAGRRTGADLARAEARMRTWFQ